MITPGVLKILSYIAAVVAVTVGLFTTFTADPIAGVAMTVLGPIVVRIYAELMLVVFEIHGELKKISNK